MNIVMMGTGTFARPTFEALLTEPALAVVGLVTQPDRDAGHVRGSTRQTGASLKEVAQARGVAVYQPDSINTPEGVAQLKAWQPDLLVVAAYGQILKADVLNAAPWGGINVHASLLPKYRGAAPVAWAILRGETRTGVTIIRMTTGLDAGDMLAQDALDILPDETAGELEARLAPIGARLALEVVERFGRSGCANGPPTGIKQDMGQVTKAPKLKKEDGLIDWSQSADQVCRQVRAMQPWPTAYTFLHQTGKPPLRLTVQKAAVASRERERPVGAPPPDAHAPGSPVVEKDRLLVTAVDGLAEIVELQPAGKRRMGAAEFLRGRALRPGDVFGPESLQNNSG
jgi:methionyl-tRNA formyltransferase